MAHFPSSGAHEAGASIMSTWTQVWHDLSDTLGVTAAFAGLGSGMALWINNKRQTTPDATPGQALTVIAAGQLVAASAAIFVHGYLEWPVVVAPAFGAVCGVLGIVIIRTLVKGGQRVEDRADDLADKAVSLLPGKGGDK